MEIVLAPLQENLKPTLKRIYTKISRFYTVVIISVLCDWCQIKIPERLFSSFNPSFCHLCCLQTLWCLNVSFPALWVDVVDPDGVGAGLCDLESCRTWLRVDSSELLALAEPIVLHSITGGGGSMTLSFFFLSLWGSVSTYFKANFFFSWMPNYSLLKHFAQNKHTNYYNVTFFILSMCKKAFWTLTYPYQYLTVIV